MALSTSEEVAFERAFEHAWCSPALVARRETVRILRLSSFKIAVHYEWPGESAGPANLVGETKVEPSDRVGCEAMCATALCRCESNLP
jgi:hypothetical protein